MARWLRLCACKRALWQRCHCVLGYILGTWRMGWLKCRNSDVARAQRN